jgi:hypothetical protein
MHSEHAGSGAGEIMVVAQEVMLWVADVTTA